MKEISKEEIIAGRREIIESSRELIEHVIKYDSTNPIGVKLVADLRLQIAQIEAEIERLEKLGPEIKFLQ